MKIITLDIGDESADWIKSVAKDRTNNKKKKNLQGKPAISTAAAGYLSILKKLEKELSHVKADQSR